MQGDYIYMLLILLLPLAPAFILFKFLPSSADAGGPLKGLTIKLSGAFGGYIVAVLLSWQIANSLLAPMWSDNWIVVAQVKLDGAQIEGANVSESVVLMHPPTPDINSDGRLQMPIAIPRVRSAMFTPTLTIEYHGYETANVTLDPDNKSVGAFGQKDYEVKFDAKTHRIIVGQPIILTKATPQP